MTLTLTPSAVARLSALAVQRGQTPESVVEALLQREMPEVGASGQDTGPAANPMLNLFAEWDAEDKTDDPEEINRRNREWEDLKANLAGQRLRLHDVSHLVSGEDAA